MSLSKTEAEKLFKLGFTRPDYADEVYSQDLYEYNNESWIVGGRILPSSTLFCEEEVYRQGIWIPAISDLITWLEEMNMKFDLHFDGSNYKVEVSTNKKLYKGKGISVEISLFKAIIQILRDFGGPPVQKKYTVIEAEYIEKRDI